MLECPDLKSKLKPRYIGVQVMCATSNLLVLRVLVHTALATGTAPSSHMTTLVADLVCTCCVNQRQSCQTALMLMMLFGAASDEDRVALQSMRFATPHSAGATCMTVGQLSSIQGNGNGSTPSKLQDAADDQVHALHSHASCASCIKVTTGT